MFTRIIDGGALLGSLALLAALAAGLASAAQAAETPSGAATLTAAPLTPAAELRPFEMPTLAAPGELVDLRRVFGGPRGAELPAVNVKDGHFYAGANRVRFWGVNLCFGACFPPPEIADQMAARLAAFGVNCVRFHHMDYREFPNGIWAKGFKGLSPEALQRLDYLLAALKKEGIYANLNLHVSRDFARTGAKLGGEKIPEFGKIVCTFDPELIALQKQYARDLLSHVNQYTGLKYAEDPVVALVEISNENSIFQSWSGWVRDELSPRFADELRVMWNGFLAKLYGDDAALRKAWATGEEPRGAELLRGTNLSPADLGLPPADAAPEAAAAVRESAAWRLQQITSARMAVAPDRAPGDRPAVRITVEQVSDVQWHLQFCQYAINLEKGRFYTVRFRAKADGDFPIVVVVQQHLPPYRALGLTAKFTLTRDWQDCEVGFAATGDEADSKLMFSLGGRTGQVWLSDISLASGGQRGLGDGESLATKSVRTMRPEDHATAARRCDYLAFLTQVDRDYFVGMHQFLKTELGVRAPITGSIGMGLPGGWVQSHLDFVDAHSYWQHPSFPGRPWDPRNWVIDNTPMVDAPQRSTLVGLAADRQVRPDDKSPARPFTVTEYNHSYPSDYQAEGLPMIAAFGASQDWDGIFIFAYRHSGSDWDRRKATEFFDIDSNPVKMVQMAAGALAFRRGDIRPQPVSVVTGMTIEQMLDLAAGHRERSPQVLDDPAVGAGPQLRFFGRYAIEPFSFSSAAPGLLPGGVPSLPRTLTRLVPPGGGEKLIAAGSAQGPVNWVTSDGHLRWSSAGADTKTGVFVAEGEAGAALVGFLAGAPRQAGPVEVTMMRSQFAAVTLAALDGERLERSRKILITACGRLENSGQEWNKARTSVTDRWGQGPTLIEPIVASIKLNHVPATKARLQVLGGDGRPVKEMPVEIAGEAIKLTLSADPATLWYVLEME